MDSDCGFCTHEVCTVACNSVTHVQGEQITRGHASFDACARERRKQVRLGEVHGIILSAKVFTRGTIKNYITLLFVEQDQRRTALLVRSSVLMCADLNDTD